MLDGAKRSFFYREKSDIFQADYQVDYLFEYHSVHSSNKFPPEIQSAYSCDYFLMPGDPSPLNECQALI